jgi:hypothetical protein
MQSFVNILTGGNTFPAFYRYTEDALIYRTNKLGFSDASVTGSLKTNVANMYISFPHPDDTSTLYSKPNQKASGIIQPDFKTYILDRSIQFIPMPVYAGDDAANNLTNYIAMFNHVGTPFAPMSRVYTYLHHNAKSSK